MQPDTTVPFTSAAKDISEPLHSQPSQPSQQEAAPWDDEQQLGVQPGAVHNTPAEQHAQTSQPGQQVMATGQPVAIPVTQTAGMQAGQPMMAGQTMAMPMGQGQMMMMMPQNPPRQLLVGILLALFLGVFGAHNFYLGHNGRAVAQLLITVLTFGIGSIIIFIWALIEVIMMATGSLHDADGRPLV